jgi:2-polyprenyl-3-methyl-5-hydroxy-6-metoxy-1,4-benzoquinol methylase
MASETKSQAFWNRIYETTSYSHELDESTARALHSAREFFRPSRGARVLDIGCGAGAASIFWARTGADVTAIDSSPSAVNALRERCKQTGIVNITPVVWNAMKIAELGRFDYVFGSMILHHLEPFSVFAEVLSRTLMANGKAFWYENNGASNLLTWFRAHIVG